MVSGLLTSKRMKLTSMPSALSLIAAASPKVALRAPSPLGGVGRLGVPGNGGHERLAGGHGSMLRNVPSSTLGPGHGKVGLRNGPRTMREAGLLPVHSGAI